MAIEERLANFLKDARDWERRATNIPEKGNQYSRSIPFEATVIQDKTGSHC
jgi:hypothetical protein